jgi:alkanesulfonate monooxygenase SsuD/methylene tetrahydromethanopterin reductase-like flavin-dependent oxidoreductase (luciferase family)
MKFGAHLPLIGFGDETWDLGRLTDFTRCARELGYSAVTANDHLVFPRPWFDGPTALAAVLPETGDMDLMTTVAIPVVRGPVQSAKTLGAIDILSGGRLIVGVGPGSSERDYEAVGVPFDERWKRLDDVIRAMRGLWRGEPYAGRYYSTDGIALEPLPPRGGPPVWIGSWGSEAGLRRTARLGDGWLASAYNTTPAEFRAARERLTDALRAEGKDPASFPNGIATMFMYLTDDAGAASRVISGVVGRAIKRPHEQLAERLLVGGPEACGEKLAAYRDAGAQRVFLWPVGNELRQLEIFREKVLPLV